MREVRARLSSKGQTVIPKIVRQKLDLRPGDAVDSASARRATCRSRRCVRARTIRLQRSTNGPPPKTSSSTVTSEPASLSAWDVVVVPFPYTERLAEKRRPAVVVSADRLHQEGYFWLAMITGAGKEQRAGDVGIRDLAATGLPGPSIIRTVKLATIERDRIVRRIGSLKERERAAVGRAISAFLAT